MKSCIVYSSQTGNTKKLAQAVYENLNGEKDIFPMKEAPDLGKYDLIAIGFWLKAGKPDPMAAEYLAGIKKGKRVFLFATHGAASESDHAKKAMEHAQSLVPDAQIVGTFSCPGQANPKTLEKAGAKPQPPVWLKDAPNAVGHPDISDMEKIGKMVRSL